MGIFLPAMIEAPGPVFGSGIRQMRGSADLRFHTQNSSEDSRNSDSSRTMTDRGNRRLSLLRIFFEEKGFVYRMIETDNYRVPTHPTPATLG